MRRFDDPYIECPFYKEHMMPSIRLTWHITKCKNRFIKEHPNSPVIHCKHHYLHIFFDLDTCKFHEENECEKNPILEQQKRLD